MCADPVCVGVVDSGFGPHQQVAGDAAFVLRDSQLLLEPSRPDRLGHGRGVIDVIQTLAPDAHIVSAQVFQDRFTTTALQVASAMEWLLDQGVRIINLSLGLRQDRPVLRQACERALEQGVLVCGASPARGEPVYPAAYPGVFRMTGDARCERQDISCLNTAFADFGACVLPLDGRIGAAGASLGCAHLSGHLARYLAAADKPCPESARLWLEEQSVFHGPERRRAVDG